MATAVEERAGEVRYRLVIMGVAVLWFGYFSSRVIIEYGGQLF